MPGGRSGPEPPTASVITPTARRWWVLALVTLAHALGALSVLAVAPLSPLILDDLGLTRAQVGWLLPAIYLGGVVMSLPAGWVADRLGARLTLALGQALTGSLVLAAARAPTWPAMLPLLAVAGLGWAVINPATGRALLEHFPARERGMAMGVKQTGLTLGGIAGAALLPRLGEDLGWREALALAALVSVLSAALVMLGLPRGARGAAGGDRPRLAEVGAYLSRRTFRTVLACGLALSVAQASVLAYLALYAREQLGTSLVAAGGLLAAAQAGGTVARLGWGVVSDRFFGGRRRPGLVTNALIGAATYLVFAAAPALSWPAAALVAVVAGAGAFGWVGLYLALAAEIGGGRHAGLLTGVAVSAAWSGILIGPPLFGLLLEATGSYRASWAALAAVVAGAALALHRLPPLVRRG